MYNALLITMEWRNVDNQADDRDAGWIRSVKESFCFKMLVCLAEEICPCLTSPDQLRDSLQRAKNSIRSSPCTSFLYACLALSGFIPVLCFSLCVCGTFILFGMAFLLCHSVAVIFAAMVCAGVFVFIVVMSCILAAMLGLVVHLLSLWGWTSHYMSQHLQHGGTYLHGLVKCQTTETT